MAREDNLEYPCTIHFKFMERKQNDAKYTGVTSTENPNF